MTTSPFFLLGAGFGADAGRLVGPIEAESLYIGKYRFACEYPLVRDLPVLCFPDASPPVSVEEIEHRLGIALAAGDVEPFKRLSHALGKADHYLAPRLVGWPTTPNAYAKFFGDFPESSFGTYNYDAFVEYALFRAGRWSPHDGFGVPVAVEKGFTAEPYEMRDSTSLVLHLHGTYSVYEYSHAFGPPDLGGVQWMQVYEKPRYAFDPVSLSFYPCERFMAGLAYDPRVERRVVAPIPDKATGLTADFIQIAMRRTTELALRAQVVVAIGYAFSQHDRASYAGLLDALAGQAGSRLLVVCPDAEQVVERIRQDGPAPQCAAAPMGFADWVNAGYPYLSRSV